MNDLQFVRNIENTLLASYFNDYTLLENTNFKEDFFYFNDNREIFKAMQNVVKKELPLDEDFILKEFKNNENYENRLLDIITILPNSQTSHIESLLIEDYEKRELKKYLTQKIAELDEAQSLKVLNDLQNFKLQNVSKKFPIQNTKTIVAEAPEFYLEDFCPIQKKEINLFTGKGGKGKSFALLLLLSKLQNLGLKCFGWFSEDSVSVTKNRLDILRKAHFDLQNVDIDILGKDFRLQNFIKVDKNGNYDISDFFFEFTKAMKPYDIILLDPLVSLICKDENSNIEARFLMNLLNSWIEKENKTLLLIHHEGKGENSGSRGASAIIDAVRIHFTVNSVENKATHRNLKLEKFNHYQGKNEFLIQLFKSEIKHTEIVFEDKKEDMSEDKLDMSAFDLFNDKDVVKAKKEWKNDLDDFLNGDF